MKKHLNRIALMIGLALLALAVAIMMVQTFGRKHASTDPSVGNLFHIEPRA